MAAPTTGSGSVGFPHSANFTLTFIPPLLQHKLTHSGLCSASSFPFLCLNLTFTSFSSPTCSHCATPPSLFSMCASICVCADSLAGVCRCSPYHSASHKPVPAPPNTHTALSSHSETVMSVPMNSLVHTMHVEILINIRAHNK